MNLLVSLLVWLVRSLRPGPQPLALLFLAGLVTGFSRLAAPLSAQSAPSAPNAITFAADAFGRMATSGWGSADIGGAYRIVNGATADYSVSSALGNIVATPGGRHLADLPDVSARDVDVTFQVQTSQAPAGDSQYVYAAVRRALGNTEYRAQVRLAPGGAVALQATRVNFSYAVPIGAEVVVPGLTAAPNVPIQVHVQANGASPTVLQMKAWATGQPEPASWLYSATDNGTDLQETGDVGLGVLVGSASTVASTTFGIANLRVASVGAPANVVWKPYLNQVGPTSAIVQWATYGGSNPQVAFSTDTSYSSRASGASRPLGTLGYQLHRVALNGLQPATTYNYKIVNDGTDELPTDLLSFTTAPPVGSTAPFTFLTFGDFGSNSATEKQLRDQILRENGGFVLLLGDNAYPNGTYQEYNANVFPIYREIFDRTALFPALGNHDWITSNGGPYVDIFDLPVTALNAPDQEHYYAFDWGNAHFDVLDTEAPLSESPSDPTSMYAWLTSDLARTTQPWKIVAFHRPAYSTGGSNALVDANLVPIFEQYGVDLVLAGHVHAYERTYPLKQGAVTTTGQGGIVYIVSGSGDTDSQACGTASWEAFNACQTGRGNYTRVTLNDNQIALQQLDYAGQTIDSASWSKSSTPTPATPTSTPIGSSTPTPVPSASPTPSVTPRASATPPLTATATGTSTTTPTPGAGTIFALYGDSFAPGWQSSRWTATVNPASTSYVYSGADAVAFTITGPWGAFAPNLTSGSLDTTPYSTIRFYINGESTGGQMLGLMLRIHSTQAWGKLVRINQYITGGTVTANQWQQVDIPLSTLGMSATRIDRIALQDVSGTAQPEVSVDQIEFR
ncbi:MAG TPA: metallophosphoesterase family protein [Chloroflexota bacterium]|nr:metallophosphoesterase family protein [Chloroflexota bacterium]